MANPTNVLNIKVQPAYAYYGKRGSFSVACVADVADNLDGTYFVFQGYNSSYDLVDYYLYINTDPVIAGKTGISATVATNDTASAVATAISTAINLNSNLKASVSGSTVTIKSLYFGVTTAAVDTGATGFTFTQNALGFGGSLGATTDAIEFTMEPQMVDVTLDQEGTQIADKILTGVNASASFTLQELTLENYKLLIGNFIGEVLTPNSEDLIGIGESKKFKNMKQYAGELILKPINATSTVDDVYMFIAIPTVDSASFSGTSVREMPVSFQAIKDDTKALTNNLFVIGDGLEYV